MGDRAGSSPAPGTILKMLKILQAHITFPPKFRIFLAWMASLAGLFCWTAYLLSSPAYEKSAIEWGLHFPSFFSDWGWFYGGICWVFFWKFLPTFQSNSNLSPKTTFIGFLILFLTGIFTRFWDIGHFQGQYGLDQVMVYQHVQNILAGNYRLLEDFGSRPPFSRFAVAALCKCLPGIEITTALRATNAFFDVIALVVFYWFGKTWISRRAGLLLMGLGLISRPMLYKAYWGIDYNLLSLLVPLALGATLWALQKPNLVRFLSWGIVVTFGIYVVTAYRPWIPILISGTGWILWSRLKGTRRARGIGFCYVFGLTAFWFFVFFLSHNFIFTRAILSPVTNKITFSFVVVLFFFWTFIWFPKQAPHPALRAWGAGSLLALGIFGIIAADPIFSSHVEILAFWKTKVFRADPWGISAVRFNYLWDFLALKGGDFNHISDPRQPFFDLATGLAVLFGLTRLLGKPSLDGIVLGFLGLGAMSLFLVSFSPHSGRLYSCLFPFYALAAFALEDAWKHLSQELPNKWLRFGALTIVLAVGTIILASNFADVWNWMDTENVESIMAKGAREAPSTSQVYLVSSATLRDVAVDQLEGKRNAVWWKSPYKKPGSAKLSESEIRFLVPADNLEALRALKKFYPSAEWIGRASQKGDPEIKVWEVTAPGRSFRKSQPEKG